MFSMELSVAFAMREIRERAMKSGPLQVIVSNESSSRVHIAFQLFLFHSQLRPYFWLLDSQPLLTSLVVQTMLLTKQERLKALPHITVMALEACLTAGFERLGHRNLTSFMPTLEGMTWKTALSTHLNAYMALSHLLLALLQECRNGIVPDSMLEKAARLHA